MRRILVLDDEAGFQLLLKEILTRAGYDVVSALSGLDALNAIADQKVDLLLIDNRMPGMTGLEFLKLLRAAEDWSPVIVMTAYADVPVVVESMRFGALDFLIKPFQIESVVPLIERCLNQPGTA